MKQIYGTKVGMSRLFTDDGQSVPVTLIVCEPNVVTQVKTTENDGYPALQVGFGAQKPQRLNRASTGHFAAAKKGVFRHIAELRTDAKGRKTKAELQLGDEIKVEGMFESGELVDVTGVSIGKGFAGVVKKHHMKGNPATRGTHETRRHPGSIGNRKNPGRVFKNKRMPGHMGDEKVTQMRLTVMSARPDDNVVVIKGSIPGPKGAVVLLRSTAKPRK